MENAAILTEKKVNTSNEIEVKDLLREYVLIKKLEDLQREALQKNQPWIAMALVAVCDAIDEDKVDQLVSGLAKITYK